MTTPSPTIDEALAVARNTAQSLERIDALRPVLDTLEQHECWNPYFNLLQKITSDKHARRPEHFVRYARAQYLYLENTLAAAEIVQRAVTAFGFDFPALQRELLVQILRADDWSAEATILGMVADTFPAKHDQISCRERICLLYEKKLHNEAQLHEAFDTLLRLDPKNIKALRFFKLMYTQSAQWEDVVKIIQKLLAVTKHQEQVFRLGQELAAVYLYQLDQPKDALEAIAHYCHGSPLDSSTIAYDAYQRFGDWQGCLKVLGTCLENSSSSGDKAVILYKMAILKLQVGEVQGARVYFEAAVSHDPSLFESYEKLVPILAAEQDWDSLDRMLSVLRGSVKDAELTLRIDEVQTRLRDGVRDGRAATRT